MEEEKTDASEGKIVKQVKKEKINNQEGELTKKMRGNPWIVSTFVLVAMVLVLGFFMIKGGGLTGNVISGNIVADNLVSYLNTLADDTVSLVSVEDQGSFYLVTVKYKEQDLPVYTTKDGAYYTTFLSPIRSSENVTAQINTQQQTQEVPKSDKPKVELFVMTYCPYGTQAEKGIIPAIKALGQSIDAKIRFVHYFMHGDKEEQEAYNQVCIREEQSAKFLDYLACFLEDSNSDRCLTKVGIDKTKLSTCLTSKAKQYYADDSKLSEGYGVQGSPTLVVNSIEVSSGRDSASYLRTICSAFTEGKVPASCSTKLSSTAPSSGFGYSNSSASSSAASCG